MTEKVRNEDETDGLGRNDRAIAKPPLRSSWVAIKFRITDLNTNIRLIGEGICEFDTQLWAIMNKHIRSVISGLESVTRSTDELRRYTPDLILELSDGTWTYVEVKSKAAAEKEKFKREFALLQREYAQCGRSLILLTPDDLPSPRHIINLRRFYLSLACLPPDTTATDRAVSLVESKPGITLGDLVDQLIEEGQCSQPVWYALALNHIRADMDLPIDRFTPLWRTENV